VERREASVPRHGTQGASQAPDTPRHGVSNGCLTNTRTSLGAPPTPVGVSEAKRQSPDAAMRARGRDGLFDMVKNAASDGRPDPSGDVRPHPEERACGRRPSNPNVRARVSKDEDRCEVHFGQTNAILLNPVVPAQAGTHDHRRCSWVPSLATLGRDDDPRNAFGQTKPRCGADARC
jgi:hypothetical protein